MIRAIIDYTDGTQEEIKVKSYMELSAYMEKERKNGAIGFRARSDRGNRIESREYEGGVTKRADGA